MRTHFTHTHIFHIPYICAPSQNHTKTHKHQTAERTHTHTHALWTAYSSRFIKLTELRGYWSSVNSETDQRGTNQTAHNIFSKQHYAALFTMINVGKLQGDKILTQVISPSCWKLQIFITPFFRDDMSGTLTVQFFFASLFYDYDWVSSVFFLAILHLSCRTVEDRQERSLGHNRV